MGGIFQKMPIQALLMIPFPPLAKLTSHKQHFFPGMGVHESQKEPQVSKFLPVIARHPAQQRSLAVDHFIMRKGKDEIFSKSIPDAESQLTIRIRKTAAGSESQEILFTSRIWIRYA